MRPIPSRWALSRATVAGRDVSTAALDDRNATIVENYFSPILDGRPARDWALVRLVGAIDLRSTLSTRLLPDLALDEPLARLSRTRRLRLRSLLGAIEYEPEALDPALTFGDVLAAVFRHLEHSRWRPRRPFLATHNTESLDNFATDPAGRWTFATSGGSAAWDAANAEYDMNLAGGLGARYSAADPGNLDHEAQVTTWIPAAATRGPGPAVRFDPTGNAWTCYCIYHGVLARFNAGARTSLANPPAPPNSNFVSLRLAARGAPGAAVDLATWNLWHGAGKPDDPGWIGMDASPVLTYSDTAVDRLDDATATHCGISDRGGITDYDTRNCFYKQRAVADRGVSVVAWDAPTVTVTTTASASRSIAHTVGAAANRCLWVVIWNGGTSITVSGTPTFAGQPLTPLAGSPFNGNPVFGNLYVYRLIAPPSGSGTLSVTLAAAATSTIAILSASNVHQTTPNDALDTDTIGDDVASTNATTPSAAGDEVVDIVAANAWPVGGGTAGGNQTVLANARNATEGHGLAISRKPGMASVVSAWTLTGGVYSLYHAQFNVNGIAAPAEITLDGAASGAATAAAALVTAITLAGAAAGAGLAAAGLTTAITLGGAALGAGSAAGSLMSPAVLAGEAAGVALAAGALDTAIPVAGEAVGASLAAGALDTGIHLAATAIGAGTAAGGLETAVSLAGVAEGAAEALGALAPSTAPSVLAPSLSPVHPIEIAIVAVLKADAALAAIVGDRVFTNMAEGATFPLVLVEGPVETPWNSLRRRGAYVSVQIRAGAAERGTATVHAVISHAKRILDGARLDLGGEWLPAFAEFDNAPPPYPDNLAGVVIWLRPAIFRVWARRAA